jgi:hypothetical protein
MTKPADYHPMHKHPRGPRRQVLVYSCYDQWIVAQYDTEERCWDDEESRINNEKLWHYVWTELPKKPDVKAWKL